MLYKISEQVKNNIFVFLDRVKFEGIKEITAVNEIISVLSSPVKEKEEDINNK